MNIHVDSILRYCRGFSVVDLVEEYRTRSKFAVKRIMCHSTEDEQIAMKEVGSDTADCAIVCSALIREEK